MSQTEALARARTLRDSLLDHGVRAVSIELVEGRGGSGWSDDRFVGTMGHHIVSHRGQGLTPGLNLVKRGRTDLPGPLCNGYGGFDEIARIICMGWANHSGAGGPYTVPSGTVPANNGRPYWFGWEHEGGIHLSDWTDSFRKFMGRCHAGTLAWLALDEQSHLEHKTWAPTRKVDRLGYSLGGARAEAAQFLNQQEDTMAAHPAANHSQWVQQHRMKTLPDWVDDNGVWDDYVAAGGTTMRESGVWGDTRADAAWRWNRFVRPLQQKVTVLEKQVAALATRVAALERPAPADGLTEKQVKAIVNSAVVVVK